jgi:hypothetical protein
MGEEKENAVVVKAKRVKIDVTDNCFRKKLLLASHLQ